MEVARRENGFVTEAAYLMEGDWSCYGGGQLKEEESSLRRWPF